MSTVRKEDVRLAVANMLADIAEEHEIMGRDGRIQLLHQIEAAAAEIRRAL